MKMTFLRYCWLLTLLLSACSIQSIQKDDLLLLNTMSAQTAIVHPSRVKPKEFDTASFPRETEIDLSYGNYYVATDGNNKTGDGSQTHPWATISHALKHVPAGATVLVQPGTYVGQVELRGVFSPSVTIRSVIPYQARLRDDGRERKFSQVLVCHTCQGMIIEGFDIAHSRSGVGWYVVQIQDRKGDGTGGQRIVLRNNILHDSYNNDIVKVNNGASQITFEGNIFYNQGATSLDSHIDANSVSDVVIQDNIFFNDYSGSRRKNLNNTGSFIVIKDSNGADDAYIGSENIVIRRNIFLNWQGDPNNTFIVVGEDNVAYFQAHNILVENNLLLGNSAHEIRAPFQMRGVRDITIRHNTIVGDLPAKAFAMRLSRGEKNPRNTNIHFYHNIWSDPTGSMGAGPESGNDFSDTKPEQTESFALFGNLYWNGGNPIPFDERELVNYRDDRSAVIAAPLLSNPDKIIPLHWNSNLGRFANGSSTIRQIFINLVDRFAVLPHDSPAIDKAVSKQTAFEDILGKPRPIGAASDIGAYERQP